MATVRERERTRRRPAAPTVAPEAPEEPAPPPEDAPPAEEPASLWDRQLLPSGLTLETACYVALAIVAVATRFWDLGSRAMHHDESQHAYFSWKIYTGSGYSYNPMLHGPFLFHAVALLFFLFGVSDATSRFLPAIAGVGLVLLPIFLRRHLGRTGAVAASTIIAISPSFLYFARFLHDGHMAFLTLTVAVCVFLYVDNPSNRKLLYLASCVLALAFTAKETTFISAFIFGTFLLLALAWENLPLLAGRLRVAGRRDTERRAPTPRVTPVAAQRERPFTDAIRATPLMAWVWTAVIFVATSLLVFMSFNPFNGAGARTAFREVFGLTYWLQQHSVQRGSQPPYYYALLIPAYEQLALLFGLIGCVWILWRERTRFALFSVYWWVASFLIYSWAGEKMPWLILMPLTPLVLVAAIFLGRLIESRGWGDLRYAGLTIACGLVAFSMHTAWNLAYYNGDVPVEMEVYTQTSPDVPKVAREIHDISYRLTGGPDAKVLIDADPANGITWPFVWYLRDFEGKGLTYSNGLTSAPGPDVPVVLWAAADEPRIRSFMTDYTAQRYRLRWWFPEDYRGLTWRSALGHLTDPQERSRLWRWLMWREPFDQLGSFDFVYYVRRGLFNSSTIPQSMSRASGAVVGYEDKAIAVPALLEFGQAGSGDAQFNEPRGLAVDKQGNIYVADSMNNRIEKFDASGKLAAKWGEKGDKPGQFQQPSGVAVAPDGTVLVADLWNHRIQAFDAAGVFRWAVGTFGESKDQPTEHPLEFYGPRDVAVDAQGNIYVTDTGNKRVQKLDPQGKFLQAFGGGGSGQGQFQEPIGIAVDAQGNVYVADTWNHRVQKLSGDGKFIAQWPIGGWAGAPPLEPFLAVAGDTLYVSDPPNQRILRLATSNGAITGVFGTLGAASGQFNAPTGLAVDAQGQLYVADTLNNRVQKLAPPQATR